MNSKIVIFAFVACYQLASTQRPTAFPNLLGTGATPSFLGPFTNNWARPYYTAAAEGWRTYFEQLQNARNQLYQNFPFQNASQNVLGSLIPPAIDFPVQNDNVATQPAKRPTSPQVQSDVQQAVPQGPAGVNTAGQGQTSGRQPQTAGLPGLNTVTRPINSQIPSGVIPPIGNPMIPSIIPQVPSWAGK